MGSAVIHSPIGVLSALPLPLLELLPLLVFPLPFSLVDEVNGVVAKVEQGEQDRPEVSEVRVEALDAGTDVVLVLVLMLPEEVSESERGRCARSLVRLWMP
jgi:hypothetical protein